MTQGILTGCNERQEWMLKSWWHYYAQTNTYPVTFMDFGMSKSARMWCEKRGQVISVQLPTGIPTPKEKIDPKVQEEWEIAYDNPWQARQGWFYKPFALTKSPYQQTYWTDIDTFIIKPLTPLFKVDLSHIALPKEVFRVLNPAKLRAGEVIYNTSVVGYDINSPVIQKWVKKIGDWNQHYLGDQDILSRIIFEDNIPITILPSIFNVRPQDGIPPDTFIIHFGNIAKKELYRKVYKPHKFL